MANFLIYSLDKTALSPFEISPMLRKQLQYFTDGEVRHAGSAHEFFFPLVRTSLLLEQGVFHVVSPLDDQNQAEIEITDEQEDLLQWLVRNQIERVRVSEQ